MPNSDLATREVSSVSDRRPISHESVRTLETEDIGEIERAFARWNHTTEQLGPGRFLGRLRSTDLGAVQLFDIEMNLMVRSRGYRADESYAFSPVQAANAESRWRGRVLRPGMINITAPEQEMDHRTCRDYRHAILTIRRDLLLRASIGLTGVELDRLLHGDGAIMVDPSLCESLARRIRAKQAFPAPIADPWSRDPEAESSLMDLVSSLLRTLAAGRVVDPFRTTHAQRLRIVRVAEEFMWAHVDKDVNLLHLCELTGVSERTLHYAFLEATGMTPKAYLKTLRLNRARRDLHDLGPGHGHIEAVARRWGFQRPGNFAFDYRRLFGVLPSQDLGRKRSETHRR